MTQQAVKEYLYDFESLMLVIPCTSITNMVADEKYPRYVHYLQALANDLGSIEELMQRSGRANRRWACRHEVRVDHINMPPCEI